jgi:hypothetical protein
MPRRAAISAIVRLVAPTATGYSGRGAGARGPVFSNGQALAAVVLELQMIEARIGPLGTQQLVMGA